MLVCRFACEGIAVDPVLVPRHAVLPEGWDAFVEAHDRGWVWHLSAWLDYLVASGRKDESYAVMDGSRIVGLCPVCLPVPTDDPLPAPIGINTALISWPTRGQPQRERTPNGFETRVIDLSLNETALWTGLRRSSHALIHRAEETYAVTLASSLDGLASLYAGRPDLPQLNMGQWECLGRLHESGVLRVYEARHRQLDGLVGAVALDGFKNWWYYAHGRSVVLNVNLLLLWRAALVLKSEGCPWLEIGWTARPEDDEKAKQIAYHKQAFGGEMWWIPT